jgi:hypothetical protein
MMIDRYFQAKDGTIRRVHPRFHWLAFWFGSLWAFANRAWLLGLIMFLAELPISIGADHALPQSPSIAVICFISYIAFEFVAGRFGQAWLAWSFKHQGYKELARDAT